MNITVSTDSGRTPCGQNPPGTNMLRRPVLVCHRPNHNGKVSPLPPRRVECKSWVWRALEELAEARDTGVAAIVDAAIKDYVIAHGARPSNAPQTPCEREDGLPHNRHAHRGADAPRAVFRASAPIVGGCVRRLRTGGGRGSFQKIGADAHRPRSRGKIAR